MNKENEVIKKLAQEFYETTEPSADEMRSAFEKVEAMKKLLIMTDSLDEETAEKRAIEVIQQSKTKARSIGSSALGLSIKEMLFEMSESGRCKVTVSESAEWLKERKGYNPKRNNAIGDVLGHGFLFLSSSGTGKNKSYDIPNHHECSEFYSHPEDVPPRSYYSEQQWNHVCVMAASLKKKSRFLEQMDVQMKRQPAGKNRNTQ